MLVSSVLKSVDVEIDVLMSRYADEGIIPLYVDMNYKLYEQVGGGYVVDSPAEVKGLKRGVNEHGEDIVFAYILVECPEYGERILTIELNDLNDIYTTRNDVEAYSKKVESNGSELSNQQEQAQVPKECRRSDSALKVVGLMMEYLASSQGAYRHNDKPNFSRIRDFLLKLAEEHGIKKHGLEKSNERVLKDAYNYLQEQKVK